MLTQQDLEAVVTAVARVQAAWLPPYTLGRQLQFSQLLVSVTVPPFPLVNADPNRVLLMFAGANGSGQTVCPAGIGVFQMGWPVTPAGPPLILTAHDHGVLPQLAWECTYTGGGTDLYVCQLVWSPPQ